MKYSYAVTLNMPLFNEGVSNWNQDKIRFVYWIRRYYDATTQMDGPSNQELEDDTLFDQWAYRKAKKQEKDFKANKMSNSEGTIA